jgi:signal transduction histidine kinase/CheY-like chemotaxis protein
MEAHVRKKSRNRRQKIGRRLITLVIAVSSCIAVITTAAQLLVEYGQQKEEVINSLDAVNLYLPSMAASVWNVDVPLIETTLSALGHLPAVESVTVRARGRDFLSGVEWNYGSQQSRSTIKRYYTLQHTDNGVSVTIADLEITASVDTIYKNIAKQGLTILVANTIKTFIVAIFMLTLVRRLITARIEDLAMRLGRVTQDIVTTEDVDNGEPAAHGRQTGSDPHGSASAIDGDEIEDLCRDFDFLVGRLRDYSGRMEAKVQERTAQLATLNAELAKYNDALRQATSEAERANESKSRFLAAASHDLRQPLQALCLYFGALAGRLSPSDAPIMKHIDACLGGLNALLLDLLDLSKLDAEVVQPDVTDFSLADLFRDLVSAQALPAEAKGIRLRTVPTKLWAKSDPILLKRIVGNLVANAVRYTEQGGVVIGCRRRGGTVWVEVVDTGIGIPEDKHEMIFEEFLQLGNQERSSEKGTGLGLAIVKKTAALLGLEIRVTSRIGRGSIFALSVPMGVPARNHASPPSGESQPLLISLVEDDTNVREALAFSFTSLGHTVVEASSGEALMARLGDRVPDFILIDYCLGDGKSGLDVVEAVRAKFGEDVPVAVLTGDTDPAVVRRMDDCRVTVLHKPIHLDAIKAILAKQRVRV